jgi:endonuclease/exonuclease/phosphatase (EEP) superfamily protein YafD
VRSLLAWLCVLPFAGWALVRGFGLDRMWPLVGVVAFTTWAVAGALLATVVAFVLRRRLAGVVGVVSLAVLTIAIAPRAIGDGDEARAGAVPMRILTLNLLHDGARPTEVLSLVRQLRVHVLCVQELSPAAEAALYRAGIKRLLPFQVRARGDAYETSVFAVGPVRPTRAPGPWAAVRGRAKDGPAFEIHSIHPVPPTSQADLRSWRGELRAIPSAGEGPLRIAAGDFNGTLDHREMRHVLDRGYVDAAEQAGAGLRPTWPVGRRIPPEITIDHVLADERISVGDVSVHPVEGSDHRAVFAELFLPADAG